MDGSSAEESSTLEDADQSRDVITNSEQHDRLTALHQGDVEESAEVWAVTNGWTQSVSKTLVSPDGSKRMRIERVDPKSGDVKIRCNSELFNIAIFQNPLESSRFRVDVKNKSPIVARYTHAINSALASSDDQSLEEALHTIFTSLAIYTSTEQKGHKSDPQTETMLTHIPSDWLRRCATVKRTSSGHQIEAVIRLSDLNINPATFKYLEMKADDTLRITLETDGHTSMFDDEQGHSSEHLKSSKFREARLSRIDGSAVRTSNPNFQSYGVKEYVPNIMNKLIDEYNDSITLGFEQGEEVKEKKGSSNDNTSTGEKTAIHVLEKLIQRIEDPGKFCVYCAEELKVGGVIPRPCQKDLCRFIYEESGVDVPLIHFFRDEKATGGKSNEDALLSLKFQVVAALWSTYHPKLALAYEPFPSFMLSDRINRRRAGIFENGKLPKTKYPRHSSSQTAPPLSTATSTPRTPPPALLPSSFPAVPVSTSTSATGLNVVFNATATSAVSLSPHHNPVNFPAAQQPHRVSQSSNTDYDSAEIDAECEYKRDSLSVIASELGSLPWKDLAQARNEASLSLLLSRLQYKLIRHLLFSNPVELIPLHEAPQNLPRLENSSFYDLQVSLQRGSALTGGYQFEYRGDQTEAGKKFERRRGPSGSPPTKRKTIFAFHGTPIHNLHTVLRFGLLNMSGTVGMQNGSALGEGVYFTTCLKTALGYSMRNVVNRGTMVDVSEAVSSYYSNRTMVVLVCEVFQDCVCISRPRNSGSHYSIFTVKDANDVAIRYILTFPSQPPPLPSKDFALIPDLTARNWTFDGEAVSVEAFQRRFNISSYKRSRGGDKSFQAAAAAKTEAAPTTPAITTTAVGALLPLNSSSQAPRVAARVARSNATSVPIQYTRSEHTSPEATTAVTRSLKLLSKETSYRIELVGENIFCWRVFLSGFEQQEDQGQDQVTSNGSPQQQQQRAGLPTVNTGQSFSKQLAQWATTHNAPCAVEIELLFSRCDYPASPPFVRVIRPKLSYRTGHVTVGGSICTYNLTPSGWNPANSIVTVVEMVKVLLVEGGARIANSLDGGAYSYAAAYSAYERVRRQHGWV